MTITCRCNDDLVELIGGHLEHIRRHLRLASDRRWPTDRHLLQRIVRRVGRSAGVVVHPRERRQT
jgi:hypothetical protein